jgi:hypothetical protein
MACPTWGGSRVLTTFRAFRIRTEQKSREAIYRHGLNKKTAAFGRPAVFDVLF